MNETERDELVATIADQAAVMSHIVEDFLIGAQAHIGTLSVASVPVNLRAQLTQVIERTHTDKQVALQIEGTATAQADPAHVRQIIRNLLRNAEIHGGENVIVRLSNLHDATLLKVTDDGPGIPIEDQQRVFEPFETVSGSGSQPDSLGIGLSVARQLARLMDGELSYRHETGYSTFTLSLPAHRTNGGKADKERERRPASSSLRPGWD